MNLKRQTRLVLVSFALGGSAAAFALPFLLPGGRAHPALSLLVSLLFSLLLVACAAGAWLWLDRKVLSRVERVSQSMQAIGALREMSARVVVDGDDEVTALASSVNDMLRTLEETQRDLRAKEAQRRGDERYRSLVDTLPEAILIFRNGECAFANPAAALLLGANGAGDLAGRPLPAFYPDGEQEKFLEFHRQAEAGQTIPRVEGRMARLDGSEAEVEVTFTGTAYEGRRAVQAAVRDLTQHREAKRRLDFLAFHDSLTGLPNILSFSEVLDRELSRARRRHEQLAVVHLDVASFRDINEAFGMDAGDRAIRYMAERLSATVRGTDTVARLAGDRFLLLLAGVKGVQGTEEGCRRIASAFAAPFRIKGEEVVLVPHMGVSLFPGDGEAGDELVRHAEVARNRAREANAPYQFFSAEMVHLVTRRKSLEAELRRAIDRGELLLHYQPEFDLATGTVVGAESLVRWNHPERGLVPPMEFIPLAEETGLIIPLSRWVIRTACTRVRAWIADGYPPLRVAVNISPRLFEKEGFTEMLFSALEESGVPPRFLEAEITESMAMKDFDTSLRILNHLAEVGVPIAIDDFGTGHSSLAYLKKFPARRIKIDRSFIRDMAPGNDDAAISQAVVAMSHTLKMRCIAEGVETEEQANMLREWGCDEVQGFLFGRPVPEEEFERLWLSPTRIIGGEPPKDD